MKNYRSEVFLANILCSLSYDEGIILRLTEIVGQVHPMNPMMQWVSGSFSNFGVKVHPVQKVSDLTGRVQSIGIYRYYQKKNYKKFSLHYLKPKKAILLL